MQNTPTSSLLSGAFLETSGHPWPTASRLSAGEQLHTCSHLNCALPANYSYPRIRNSLTLCQEHKLAGMELCGGKKKNQSCLHELCLLPANYNYSGKAPALCKKHKLAGMVLCRERVLKDATKDLLDTLDKFSAQMWEVLKVINNNETKQLSEFLFRKELPACVKERRNELMQHTSVNCFAA